MIHPTFRPLGFIALTLIAAGAFGFQAVFAGKVAPRTTMANTLVSFMDAEEIQEEFSRRLEAFEAQPLTIQFRAGAADFTLTELGIVLQKTDSIEGLPVVTVSQAPWTLAQGFWKKKEVEAQFLIDEVRLEQALAQKFFELDRPVKDATLAYDARTRTWSVTPEEAGWTANWAGFRDTLEHAVATLDSTPLALTVTPSAPVLTAARLTAEFLEWSQPLSTTVTLATAEDEWIWKWSDHLDALKWDDQNGTLTPRLDTAAFQKFITETLSPDVERPVQNLIILQDDNGVIAFDGTAQEGVAIEVDRLKKLLELAAQEGADTRLDIPVTTLAPSITAPPALEALGIKELVVTGYSTYYNSPAGRQHNIKTAIARFNGALIAPGETFSFGERLGEVDGSTGYVKELVIKEGETIPEYGGGVCQVSSTLFRAILFGGFPIVERHAHSYAVSYYANPYGWGLDATVYPPQVDLKFTNDTAHHLLIQSYVEGAEAYFKFYGTKDGRVIETSGPSITNRAAAPPPIYVTTDQLPAGKKEKKDTAHNGFTATWWRTVTYPTTSATPEARVTKDTIVSPYTPWPERWLVGAEEESITTP